MSGRQRSEVKSEAKLMREKKSNNDSIATPIVLPLLLLLLPLSINLAESSSSNEKCKAWLVQSIPTDMPDLPLVPGVLSTADVFRWLAGNSTGSLDIIAQYWQLLSHPDDPRSGDYGYSEEEMRRFGADEGFGVYKSIEEAADRNVTVRYQTRVSFFQFQMDMEIDV